MPVLAARRQAGFSACSTREIANDALTRIPVAHFANLTWAKESIASCTAMLSDVLDGDRTSVQHWIQSAGAGDSGPLVSVLSAVGDAVVADAFRSHGNVSAVSALIASIEREVRGRLPLDRSGKDGDPMHDLETAQLAAGLVRVVALHDRDTATHLDATAALARRIAVAMNLPASTTSTIELAARLHDIGKIGVRKEVLCKPGPLSVHEWREMRLHAELGAAALEDTPMLAHLAPVVRAHHERMDGYGYPDQLRAEEIPLEARVVAVADAFHAMTVQRCYRRAMMPNEALGVLADNAGTQFDFDVVEATFEVFHYSRRVQREIA